MHPDLTALDATVTALELEDLVIAAEHAAGITPTGLSRPLFPWEQHTDFAAMDRELDQAYDRAAQVLAGLQDVIVQALIDAVAYLDDPVALSLAIRDFAAQQPQAVRDAIDRAADQLIDILLDLHQRAAERMLREAALAGAAIGAAAIAAATLRPSRRDVAGTAIAPAVLLWQRIMGTAAGANTPTARGQDIATAAAGSKIDAALDLARQAAHVANGEGRAAVATQLQEPTSVYASEILDKATCKRCRPVDGRRYDKLRDALLDYPDMGPYAHCLGGSRCRGTLVLAFGEAPATLR